MKTKIVYRIRRTDEFIKSVVKKYRETRKDLAHVYQMRKDVARVYQIWQDERNADQDKREEDEWYNDQFIFGAPSMSNGNTPLHLLDKITSQPSLVQLRDMVAAQTSQWGSSATKSPTTKANKRSTRRPNQT